MKCANCGRDNPAGARYCIHCGAEHSVPTPIAAAAAIASRARRGIPQAANAAHADPIPDEQVEPVETPPVVPQTARSSGHATIVPHPSSAASASTSRDGSKLPAYASGPRRSGIALSLVGACFFIAVGGFFAWRMFAPQVGMPAPGESVVTSSKPAVDGNTAQSGAASAAASRNSAAEETTGTARNDAAQSTSSAGTSSPMTDTAVASTQADVSPDSASSGPAGTSVEADAQVDAKASSSAPVEITPLPAKPAPKAPRKTAAPQPPPQAPVAASTLPAAPAATTAQPSTPAVVVAAATKASKPTDQWAKLREELDSCTREDFIARVVCGQRVRFKYCSGSWGKVPECPGSPQGERGQ